MRIAICDDQDIFLLKLKQYLENYYKSMDVIIDTFKSGEEFLKKYNSKYEVIFLDIEMGKLNGIETAKKLRGSNKDVIIIFLTSHIEFATDGYEVNAFRFLVKPVDENKLKIALQDIEKEISNNKKILIKDKDNEILLKYKDIVYIEAQNINVSICTMNDKFVIRKTIKEFESELRSNMFFKCHRSYIINLGFVKSYDSKVITMENNEMISLSRNKVTEFKKNMMNYIRDYGN